MHKMEKLFEKKKKMGKELSHNEIKAKSHVLGALKDMASDEMGNKLHELKKVSVAAPDKEGLEKGLDMAKNLIHKKGDTMGDTTAHELSDAAETDEMGTHGDEDQLASPEEEGSAQEEASESPEEEMSEDEIDAKLAHLMAKKHAMQLKK